eukprot:6481842-Alexandrium_andersonii.AAC.1
MRVGQASPAGFLSKEDPEAETVSKLGTRRAKLPNTPSGFRQPVLRIRTDPSVALRALAAWLLACACER